MKRISTATRALNLFGAGKDGFRDGDLVAGVAATDLEASFFNNIQEELLSVIETAGLVADGNTLTQLRQAIDVMMRKHTGAVAAAAGTVDAITGDFTPDVAAYTDGMRVYVRASGANTSTTPTFKPDALAAKTIVKGNNLPLAAGDIAGAGHWLDLQYDLTLDKWVLRNPAVPFGGFAAVKASPGRQFLPSGLLFQFVTGSAAPGAGFSNTFPLAFPAACVLVVAQHVGTDGSVNVISGTINASGVILITNNASTVAANYLAIGY